MTGILQVYFCINNILFSLPHKLLKIVQMFHYPYVLYYFDMLYLIHTFGLIEDIYDFPQWIFQSYFSILRHIALHRRHNTIHSKGPPK